MFYISLYVIVFVIVAGNKPTKKRYATVSLRWPRPLRSFPMAPRSQQVRWSIKITVTRVRTLQWWVKRSSASRSGTVGRPIGRKRTRMRWSPARCSSSILRRAGPLGTKLLWRRGRCKRWSAGARHHRRNSLTSHSLGVRVDALVVPGMFVPTNWC